MMRFLIFLAVICAAVVLGPMLSDSQGFVHMVVGNYVIETSVTTAAIIVVLFLAALWLAYSLIRHFLSIPHGTARWFKKRSLKKQDALQDAAYLAYEEGDYARTIELLNQSGGIEDLPLRALAPDAAAQRRRHLLDVFPGEAVADDGAPPAGAELDHVVSRSLLMYRLFNVE